MSLLRPTPEQMQRFARRETDHRSAQSFEPIAAGPFAAVLLLAYAGIAGALAAPFVIVSRLLRKR